MHSLPGPYSDIHTYKDWYMCHENQNSCTGFTTHWLVSDMLCFIKKNCFTRMRKLYTSAASTWNPKIIARSTNNKKKKSPCLIKQSLLKWISAHYINSAIRSSRPDLYHLNKLPSLWLNTQQVDNQGPCKRLKWKPEQAILEQKWEIKCIWDSTYSSKIQKSWLKWLPLWHIKWQARHVNSHRKRWKHS